MEDPKELIGKEVLYKHIGGKLITGKVEYIAFKNTKNTIVWYHVRFGPAWAFLVSIDEMIQKSKQLSLFE